MRREHTFVYGLAIPLVVVVVLVTRFQGAQNAGSPRPASPDAKIKNVLVILVDTLRASHLKAHNYFRETSPTFDRLAAEGVMFERAFSVSPWTRTSCASLFTGLYPIAHNVQDAPDKACDELVMMAEVFKANGFATGGFSTNVSVSEPFNMHQGFDHFTYFEREPYFKAHPDQKDPGYVPIEGMMEPAYAWLDAVGDKPFFLYFHCTDPHSEYWPPDRFALWGQNPWDRYDGDIRYAEEYLGQLIERLRSKGMLDQTLVIYTADHGEEWVDHGGMSHGHTLYNELLHVPLVFRHPSLKPLRRDETVRLIDVLPTLIDLCALKPDPAPKLHGRSLAPLLKGLPDPKPEEQFVLGEVQYPSKMEGWSYEAGGWKVIYTKQSTPMKEFKNQKPKKNLWEMFWVAPGQDVGERINLAAVGIEPRKLQELKAQAETLRARLEKDKVTCAQGETDPNAAKALRGLGYTGGGGDTDPPP